MPRSLFWIVAAIILIGYSAQKYLAVPQDGFDPVYTFYTSLVVLFTLALPFLITWLLVRSRAGILAYGAAFVLPGILSAIGFATYWAFFITSFAPDVALMDVVPRALTPGVLMGGLLGIDRIWNGRSPD